MSNRVKILTFICPDCESNNVQSVETATLLYKIKYINNEGVIDYGEQEIGAGGSDRVDHYACCDCGFIVGEQEGDIIETAEELAEWIENNCQQGEKNG